MNVWDQSVGKGADAESVMKAMRLCMEQLYDAIQTQSRIVFVWSLSHSSSFPLLLFLCSLLKALFNPLIKPQHNHCKVFQYSLFPLQGETNTSNKG